MSVESEPVLRWKVTPLKASFLAEFTILSPDGILAPSQLTKIQLPPELNGKNSSGVIFSGRGPVWLYAHLVHLAHPYAWVAVHEPRLGQGIVVTRHTPDSPGIGTLAPLA